MFEVVILLLSAFLTRFKLRVRNSAYGKVFRKRPLEMGTGDRPVAPRSPWQKGYVVRVIGSIRGSIRRAPLDPVIVIGEAHLRWLLRALRTAPTPSRPISV